jgi:hypothetical protein
MVKSFEWRWAARWSVTCRWPNTPVWNGISASRFFRPPPINQSIVAVT